ncbi:hypothetical protein Taro_037847, partial [Colocasia esculenta]|nr:hypothetical protein [Colocasia esculenta]
LPFPSHRCCPPVALIASSSSALLESSRGAPTLPAAAPAAAKTFTERRRQIPWPSVEKPPMTSDVVDSAFIFFLYLYHTPAFPSLLALLAVALFTVWFSPGGLAWAVSRTARRAVTTIPGPPGSLLALSRPLAHRTLAELARAHRALRLMAFSVGATRFVVSSHPDTAREILNNAAFADRPVKESAYELLFHRAMGFAPFGEYWRNLRRISATHMFSPRNVAASAEYRKAIGDEMAVEITAQMESRGAVEVRRVLHFGSLSSMMMSVFGRKVDFGKGGDGSELEGLVSEGYDLLGMFNWSDHLPMLGWLDLQGVRKRCRVLMGKVNAYVGRIIEEHRRRRMGDDGSGRSCRGILAGGPDFVDVLLDLEEYRLSDSDMVAVLWEMIFRGTDTVAILLEWILARMVLHPDIQAKAQSEIDAVVGRSRAVTDSDVPNFPYLQCVVKEALRMHPPGPLLSWARLATHDVHVGGHLVPAGTTAMVNMWAITHDERVWSEPDEFKPDRFMEQDLSVLGSDLRLAPFGSGRRVCPGKALGLATVHLWLAQLLQRFDWVPSGNNGVDLSECLKMSMEMRHPLVCRTVARC